MKKKIRAPRARKSWVEKALFRLLLVPALSWVTGVAGAILAAMLVSLFTLNQKGLSLAIEVMIDGVFETSVIDALVAGAVVGLPLGAITGCAVALLDRKEAPPGSRRAKDLLLMVLYGVVIVCIGVTVAAYFWYALLWIFRAALGLSPWGSYVGGALGALFGVWASFAVLKSKSPAKRHGGVRGDGPARGVDPADLDSAVEHDGVDGD